MLPNNWKLIRIADIATAVKGKKPKILYQEKQNGAVPYIDILAFEKGIIRQYADPESANLVRRDDVLIVWDGARCGLAGIGQEGAIGSTILALRLRQQEPHYTFRFLQTQYDQINQNPRGTGIPHVDPEVFWDIEVPVAPLGEQRRIVAKLEPLLANVEACQERLNKIPLLLKRFRQSVLAAACSGRLTADWREQNEDSAAADYTQEALSDFPTLPETWIWRPLAALCETIVDCPHSTPKWTNSGRLCVRTTNFKPGFLNLSEVRYVSDETFMERILRVKPQTGDILYSREGGILGIACIIPKEVELCLGQRMMLLRIHPSFSGTLLMHWLNSQAIQHRVQELIGGSASPHLNVKDIKNFPTPVPPIAEQDEIVRRVEDLFKIADRIEERYQKAKAYIDKLTQSILAKAFRGELVPQDPNDEPADVLLRRIENSPQTVYSCRKSLKKKRS